jgi:hypothetical protein
MIDRSTAGHTAEPDEVEAVLHNLCGYHLAERDPVHRYEVLTREQVLYDALVAAIRRERGRALAELAAAGHKLTQVAELTKLGSRQRVQRLIGVFRAAEAAMLEAIAASAPEDDAGELPVIPVMVPAPRPSPELAAADDALANPAAAEPTRPVAEEAGLGWPDFFADGEPEGEIADGGSWWRRRRSGAA